MTIRSVLISGLVGAAFAATGAAWATAKIEEGKFVKLELSYAQAEVKAVQKAKALQHDQDGKSMAIALADAKKQTTIQIRTVTTIRKVPVYVSAQTDSLFPLPCGFVRVHDAAALGVDPADVPNPAGKSDGEACDVKASEAAAIIAENYGAADADAQRLIDLQDWVSGEKALADTAAAQK